MDTNKRLVVKTISYRVVVALSLFLAALVMDYSAGFGLRFVVLSMTLGFVVYFIHDKLWNYFNWARDGGYEKRIRTVFKTISWRLWSLIIMFILGSLLGLNSEDAVEWSIVTNVLFFVVHYIHERLWNLVNWGKS